MQTDIWTETRGDFCISCDKARLDFAMICDFIANHSYWGLGRSREQMDAAIRNSALCFGLYDQNKSGKFMVLQPR